MTWLLGSERLRRLLLWRGRRGCGSSAETNHLFKVVTRVADERILIVDDEPHAPVLLRQILSILDSNAEIVLTSSSRVAEELEQQRTFEVVIANMFLEEVSGLELACLLQLIALPTRFILITDYRSDLIDEAIQRLQIYACLTRPFSYYQLHEVVRSALQASAQEKRRQGYSNHPESRP